MKPIKLIFIVIVIILLKLAPFKAFTQQADVDPAKTEVWKPVPEVVLTVVPGTGNIRTRQRFNDMQLHIEWQNYQITYYAPRFTDGGRVKKPARITVLHNGVLIQDNVEIKGNTVHRGPPYYDHHGAAPIVLQDHGDKVSFRNIWIREL